MESTTNEPQKSTYGHGGRRPRAGRPPKASHLHAVQNTVSQARGGRAASPPRPASVSQVFSDFDVPDVLNTDERNVWLSEAPKACANGTLTRASLLGFIKLCQAVVLENDFLNSVTERGGTKHQAAQKVMKGWLAEYGLIPNGRRMFDEQPVAKPSNPLDRFIKRA